MSATRLVVDVMDAKEQGEQIERAMARLGRVGRQVRFIHYRTESLAFAIGYVGAAATLLQEQADRSTGAQRRLLSERAGDLDALFCALRVDLAPLMLTARPVVVEGDK